MFDESTSISARTLARTVANINKIGYSDGVVDGEINSFQSSFDMGYLQGLKFGLDLGYNSAIIQQTKHQCRKLIDPNNINCQICLDGIGAAQNVVNLYNKQEERNYEP